jgi:hypothetical protein
MKHWDIIKRDKSITLSRTPKSTSISYTSNTRKDNYGYKIQAMNEVPRGILRSYKRSFLKNEPIYILQK